MKTLVAVSALVALAIAAPAQPGDGLAIQDWHPQGLTSLPDLQREKKSPSDVTNPVQNIGALHSDIQDVHTDAAATLPTGRSFTLKKPLIVKKKMGYQVYRDSEEEKALADSNETCGRQVKVKLCDGEGNLRATLKGSTPDGTHIHKTEDDVKHSIKMAKEAVENLQRDLKKMELKSSMKMAHESQSDTELHEDIEVARQALKHIHENFGNLESMSLHATSARDSDAMHDIHVTIAKTEEERMSQWKEAIANIQKNVEIARNIEDSFKDASNQESLMHLDQSEDVSVKTDKHIEESSQSHVASTDVNHMRLAHDTVIDHHLEHEANDGKQLNKATDEMHVIEHNAREKMSSEDNMNMAPSDMIQVNLDTLKTQEPLRSENHKIHEDEKSADTKLQLDVQNEKHNLVHEKTTTDHHHEGKSSELNIDMTTGQSEHHIMQVPATKPLMEESQIKLDEEKVTEFKTSENIPETSMTSSGNVKPLTTDVLEEQKVTEGKMEHHHQQHKNADDMANSDDMIDFLAKSATPLHQDNIENAEFDKEHATLEKHDFKQLDNAPKSAEHIEFHNIAKQDENVMLSKSADHVLLPDLQNQHMTQHTQLSHVESQPSMKAAEEHLHHLQHMNTGLLAHDNTHLDHLSTMKAAENVDETWAVKPKQAIHGSLHSFKQLDNAPKSAGHRKFHTFAKQNENVMLSKSADHVLLPDLQNQHMTQHAQLSHIESQSSMKAAEEHLHHLQHMNTGLLAHDNAHLDHLASMRADNLDQEFEMTRGLPHGHSIITENTMDHMRNSHMAGHSQFPSKMGIAHDFEASHVQSHLHHPGRFQQSSMMHAPMHEMTGMGSAMHSHFHPSMRDAMEGFESDHMFRWKPAHESARSAYGSGLSGSIGSSGAVGVFPNANTGGCAIPLLLSCSPSVVSGSLAKATSASAGLSSYSAPSYRTEEDFMFHNKRDVKNTNDLRTTTAKRTPTTLKQKTTQTLEKQL